MRRLPKKRFLAMSVRENASSLLIVVDILAAYAYDQRFTCGEQSVESGWTIATLSRTLSWLDAAPELCAGDVDGSELLLDCLGDSVRRILTFPYLRCWALAVLVLKDVADILVAGLRRTVKCLLQVRRIFEKDEARYLLNKLYVDPLCIWLQQCVTDEHCQALGTAVDNFLATKQGQQVRDATRWDLAALEKEAKERLQSPE